MRFWHAVWLFERDRPQGSPLNGDLRDGVALDHGEAATELLAKGRQRLDRRRRPAAGAEQ